MNFTPGDLLEMFYLAKSGGFWQTSNCLYAPGKMKSRSFPPIYWPVISKCVADLAFLRIQGFKSVNLFSALIPKKKIDKTLFINLFV